MLIGAIMVTVTIDIITIADGYHLIGHMGIIIQLTKFAGDAGKFIYTLNPILQTKAK